ncbi:MAG: hypothetical protein H0V11_02890 [Actinobacteria bacterium]|nr:hypothetical protein [Actinomycetota bacterium]
MRIALILAVALLLAPPAHAHFRSHLYSFSDPACSRISDPIGAVFYGNGDVARARAHVQHHTGWGGVVFTNTQWFYSHGACRAENGENSNGSWYETRYHIRFRQTPDWDSGLGFTTEGTPHYEEAVRCGHATRSFDAARRLLTGYMALGGHATWFEYWGNTAILVQCDGRAAWSNGYVRFFAVPL